MGVIDDVRDRLDIVEIVEQSGVELRRSGRSYVGFCPFHQNTRTPAFTVYADTQSFYCFGCQASGTVFDFVMRKQGLEFREALELLAPRAGVEIKPRTQEEQQQDQQRTRLLALTSIAARYFNYLLVSHSRGEPGRAYLEQREISTDTTELFQLGYSLDHYGHLFHYLTEKKGYTPEEVEAAGLTIRSEQHGWYDRFRGRLIFPIRNVKGEVVGFGGRALGDMQPKYLNTPQTVLFDKSGVLYGLDLAREGIRSADAAVVVEGYVDVLTAHQHGFRNVVAPLGTALTAGHVGLIKRLSRNVYLALDADAAGQRATLRGLSAFAEAPEDEQNEAARPVITAQGLVRWQRDVTLRIIKLPEGRDPDDVIKTDPQQWRALLKAAQPVMDFYIEAHTADLDLSQPQDQRAALERLVPLVRQLDSTQQRVYVAQLERVVGIRAELILDLLRAAPQQRTARGKQPPTEPARPAEQEASVESDGKPRQRAPNRREEYLLALLLRHPSALRPLEMLLDNDLRDFAQVRDLLGDTLERLLDQPANHQIYRAWVAADTPALPLALAAAAPDPTPPSLPDWGAALDETLQPQLAALVAFALPDHQEYRYMQEAESCIRHLRREQALRWQRRLSEQAQHASSDDECTRTLDLLSELQRYMASVSAPRRTSSWLDVRDTLRRPED